MTTPRDIDRLCDEFEAACKSGAAPTISSFVSRVEDGHRGRLLTELIAIDLEYRQRRNERLAATDYRELGTDAVSIAAAHLARIGSPVPSGSSDADRRQKSAPTPPHDKAGAQGSSESAPGSDVAGAGEHAAAASRYRILRPHAKGGLGQVSVALDCELNREVALKELRESHANNEDSRARFSQEAEITGGLEHPGIVPVYGLGRFSDGRPYYAMRFIRGDSLKEAIERFHGAPAGSHAATDEEQSTSNVAQHPGHGQDRQASETEPSGTMNRKPDRAKQRSKSPDYFGLEFRKLLGRFIDVCHAVSYAHSRGVLHRDLKPGNIMLGRYGETLVIDWGLARAEADTGSSIGESSLPAVRGRTDSSPTLAGSAVGTPAYMSPEQAAGRVDELGTATDIYSLGATLNSLLTGRPPVFGMTVEDILDNVKQGQIVRPRDYSSAIPRPLERICLKAMAMSPADRYSSARALAEDIERWLADEPVSAWEEDTLTRLFRWFRRHRGLLLTASVFLILTSLLATLSAIMINQFRLREQAMRQVVEQVASESELAAARARAEKLQQLESTSPEAVQRQRELRQQQIDRLDQQLQETLEPKTIAWLHMRKGELQKHPQWNDATKLALARDEFARAGALFRQEVAREPTADNVESLLAALHSQAEADRMLGHRDAMKPTIQEALSLLNQHIRQDPGQPTWELWLTTFSLLDERASIFGQLGGGAANEFTEPDASTIEQLKNLPWPSDDNGRQLRLAAIRSRLESVRSVVADGSEELAGRVVDAAVALMGQVVVHETFREQSVWIDWIQVTASLADITSSLDALRLLMDVQRQMIEKGDFGAVNVSQADKIFSALARAADSAVRAEMRDAAIRHQQWILELAGQCAERAENPAAARLMQFDQALRLGALLEESGRTEPLRDVERQLLEIGGLLQDNPDFNPTRQRQLQRLRDRAAAPDPNRDPFRLP